jgi:hypothetical protein
MIIGQTVYPVSRLDAAKAAGGEAIHRRVISELQHKLQA